MALEPVKVVRVEALDKAIGAAMDSAAQADASRQQAEVQVGSALADIAQTTDVMRSVAKTYNLGRAPKAGDPAGTYRVVTADGAFDVAWDGNAETVRTPALSTIAQMVGREIRVSDQRRATDTNDDQAFVRALTLAKDKTKYPSGAVVRITPGNYTTDAGWVADGDILIQADPGAVLRGTADVLFQTALDPTKRIMMLFLDVRPNRAGQVGVKLIRTWNASPAAAATVIGLTVIAEHRDAHGVVCDGLREADLIGFMLKGVGGSDAIGGAGVPIRFVGRTDGGAMNLNMMGGVMSGWGNGARGEGPDALYLAGIRLTSVTIIACGDGGYWNNVNDLRYVGCMVDNNGGPVTLRNVDVADLNGWFNSTSPGQPCIAIRAGKNGDARGFSRSIRVSGEALKNGQDNNSHCVLVEAQDSDITNVDLSGLTVRSGNHGVLMNALNGAIGRVVLPRNYESNLTGFAMFSSFGGVCQRITLPEGAAFTNVGTPYHITPGQQAITLMPHTREADCGAPNVEAGAESQLYQVGAYWGAAKGEGWKLRGPQDVRITVSDLGRLELSDGTVMLNGTAVVQLDANGTGTVNYPVVFSTAPTPTVSNGDTGFNAVPGVSAFTATGFNVLVRKPDGTPFANSAYRVNYSVIGKKSLQ